MTNLSVPSEFLGYQQNTVIDLNAIYADVYTQVFGNIGWILLMIFICFVVKDIPINYRLRERMSRICNVVAFGGIAFLMQQAFVAKLYSSLQVTIFIIVIVLMIISMIYAYTRKKEETN